MRNDEKNLIDKLRAKDPESFETVVRLYTTHLFNASLGLGFDKNEAQEITQSVWLTFFDVVERFEGRSSVRTFLFGILYNKAFEHRKQNKKFYGETNIENILDSHFDDQGHWKLSHTPIRPDRFMEKSQTMEIISDCLGKLPLNQKMAFVLKEIEEEITEEICNILSVTATNLRVLVFRAKNQLRECIDQKGR